MKEKIVIDLMNIQGGFCHYVVLGFIAFAVVNYLYLILNAYSS